MTKKTSITLSLALVGSLQAGVIKPLSATSSIAGDAGSSVNYLLSDNAGVAAPGLQDATGTAVPLANGDSLSTAATTYAYRSGDGHGESWTSPATNGNPVFVFDLTGGGDTAVGSAILWQYGNNGGPGTKDGGNSTRGFRVIFHTEAEGNTFDFTTETAEIAGTMAAIDGNNTIDNKAQLFFAGASQTARYAAIRLDTNYGGGLGYSGGDRYGLGEVRFATEATHDPIFVPPATTVTGTTSGAPITLNVPITNQGSASPLQITAAILGGLDATYFTVTSTLPLVVAPGATADLKVSFDPDGITGNFAANVQVTSTDILLTQATINLAAEVATPDISVPATNSFGPVANGAALQTFNVPLSNTGTGPLNINDAFFVPGATTTALFEDFAVARDFNVDGPMTVAASGQVNLPITFDPTGLKGGIYPAKLRIFSDDLDEGTTDVSVLVEVSIQAGSTLVAWWPMEGNANDASGHGFNGTATALSYGTGASAATGSSGEFNGSSSSISVPFDEALNPSSFTVTAWAFADTTTGAQAIFSSRNDSQAVDATNYGTILYNLSGAWDFWSGMGTPSPAWNETGDIAITTGQWTHLACVHDHVAKTKTLYVNGVAAATSTDVAFSRNLLENLYIGSGTDTGTQFFFDGKIDDVALFRSALTETEINTIRTNGVSGFTGLPQPANEPFAITGISISGGNIVISGASGLVPGAEYHLETGVNLDDFATVPDSTFAGGSAIPAVPVSGPRRFVRIVSGPAPAP